MATPLENDWELIQRSIEGDEAAFEQLILRYTPPLYRVIQRMTVDSQASEAVIQEAFWRVWRSLERYKNDRPFFPYLVTVAINVQRDLWRADREFFDLEIDAQAVEFADQAASPEKLIEGEQLAEMLAGAIRQMPRPYRAVLALRYDAEMSYEEIARALQLPINTVRTHLHRARSILREMMEKYDEGSG